MRNQFVILAAGQGKRLGNGRVPKVLVMLKNMPLICYLLEQLNNVSQTIKPVVVVGHMREKVKGVLGDGFFYAYQEKQLGTAHAVLAARKKIKADNILVLYGDMPFVTSMSIKKLMTLHRKKNANISMLTAVAPSFENEFGSLKSAGRIIRDSKSRVVKIVEVKDASNKEKLIKEVNPGIYMFNTQWLWENIKKIGDNNKQQEYYLTDIVEIAISQGEEVHSLQIDAKEVINVNSKEDLKKAEELL